MRCPYCPGDDTRVINSRPAEGGERIRRRRECPECSRRFTTLETVEETDLIVVKRDGSKAPYLRQKLRLGIERACNKRPVTAQQVDALVAKIERQCLPKGTAELTSSALGHAVLAGLRDIDAVAYLRFASVYKQFVDINDFKAEIREFLGRES